MSAKDKSSDEKMKKLADFRQRLEKRIEETSAELEDLLGMLELADSILLEKGFKRAEVAKSAESAAKIPETSVPVLTVEYESVVPLKTLMGDLLAHLYTGKGTLRVVLAEDKKFNVNTPPFMQFLVERVFVKMQDKDRQAVASGELEPDRMFSFKITQEGDTLKEIQAENISEDRLRELKSSVRWTLEKMYEKDRSPDV